MMRVRRFITLIAAVVLVSTLGIAAPASDGKSKEDKKKQDEKQAILKMKDEAVADLAKAKPEAAAQLKKAPGYAVFDNTGVHLLLLASVRGKGVAVPSGGAQPIYMRMKTVGAGIGAGVKDYRLIFVFKNAGALKKFTDAGWDFGGEADAAAKSKESGGASSGTTYSSPDMDVYTITKKGVALQATLGGTKFSRNSDLNE